MRLKIKKKKKKKNAFSLSSQKFILNPISSFAVTIFWDTFKSSRLYSNKCFNYVFTLCECRVIFVLAKADMFVPRTCMCSHGI